MLNICALDAFEFHVLPIIKVDTSRVGLYLEVRAIRPQRHHLINEQVFFFFALHK